MKTRFKFLASLTLMLASAAAVGCSSIDEVTNSIDCHTVCQRYADCFNADYDVDGCTDKCKANADSDKNQQQNLKTCDTCIGDRSCTSATFNCADDCAGIVP